jgi:hypothetical protein
MPSIHKQRRRPHLQRHHGHHGTKHALATGNMTLAWQEWKLCPIADHTWPNWKVHWTAAFAKMRNINCMTAGESALGGNAAEEEEQARQIASSLDNLANASIQKNLTTDSLIATNAQLTQALADMQIVIACMIPPGHPPPYLGTVLAWGANPPPAAAPSVASAPQTASVLSQRPSYWGNIKPNWNKVGYRWTHGFRVKVGHNSTCARPVAQAINRAQHGPTSWAGVGTTKATPVSNARHPPHSPPDGAIQRESLLLM